MEEELSFPLRHCLQPLSRLALPHCGVVPREEHVTPLLTSSPPNSDSSVQKLLLGTHTSDDEQNYLQVMKVKVPLDDSTIKSAEYNDTEKDTHGFGSERQRIEVETKINHHGEVNRARMMPQKTNIVATKTILGEIHIFDYHKHPMVPENDEVKPQMKLTGHTKEGYGLSWNPNLEGVLLSGSDDTSVRTSLTFRSSLGTSISSQQLAASLRNSQSMSQLWKTWLGTDRTSVCLGQ